MEAPMSFSMPMFRSWVPKGIQPWIYVLTVFCVQFSSGVYLGALDCIRGTTNFMIEDLLMLLYCGLAGMAIYFPLLFRMKFRFTNQQLLIGAAITIAVCNVVTMYCTNMGLLMIVCFISGMAKLQGTFECMSNIQLWITPRRDFAVFFPVLHIVLLTAIEGSGFLAAWFGYHFTWQMMHVFTVGTMCFIVLTQLLLCRPFCPMPQRMPLKGLDLPSGLLISVLMLMVSYIMIYGDYLMWKDNLGIRIMVGMSVILLALILHRLRTVEQPLLSLRIFTYRNVLAIMAVVALAELLLGAKHCLEEILYVEVFHLEEHTKEEQYLWALPGVYVGVVVSLLWLKVFKWKIWKLLGLGFACILGYAILMYVNIDVHTNLEQFRLAIALRGCAYCILSSSLMWALHESVHELFEFFMGLFVFNIIHMYLAGAVGYGFYTTIFSHYLSDNMARYDSHLTLTGLDMTSFNFPAFMEHDFLPSMMAVAIKQSFGIIIWIALFATMAFFLLDIPAVRTNVRRVPLWAVAGIEYLAKLSGLRRRI